MNENVENLILTQLREIRGEIGEVRTELRRFQDRTNERFDELRTMIGGHGVMLSALAGYIYGIEQRVEKLELGTRT